MTEREALKLALEALEEAWYHVGTFQPTEKAIDLYDEARTAIKEALAQPEQEFVCEKDPQGCWNVRCQLGKKCKNTPPQRTWVGLTDEEIQYCVELKNPEAIAEEVEAKLKEKNT